MAILNVVYGTISTQGSAYNGAWLAAANVTTSGTSAQSAVTTQNCVARVAAVGGAMYVLAGQNPTATVGGGAYLADGAWLDLALPEGHRIAVIDAA